MPTNRFIILADVHLGLFGEQPDGNTYGDVGFLLHRAVQKVQELGPQHVVLLGDLVNRGFDTEYRLVRSALEPIFDRCVPVLGNHELQRASIADFERNMQTRAFRSERIAGIPSLILSSGIENLPDTQWHGALDEPQLHWLDETLPRMNNSPLFAFVHHPIANTTRISDRPMFALTNSLELQSRIDRRAAPTAVFSAHTHAQSFSRCGNIAYIGAPPLGFWPHAILVVDVEPDALRFSTVRLLEDPSESPDACADDAGYRATREGESSDQSGVIPLEPRARGA